MPDRALAADSAGAIWLVDFARATLERVESAPRCPGILHEELREGVVVTRFRHLACYERPPHGHMETQVLWSEILDLDLRRIYRTTLLPVSWHADGVVVLSTAHGIGGEGPMAMADILTIDLSRP
jgi:hypothetical protein